MQVLKQGTLVWCTIKHSEHTAMAMEEAKLTYMFFILHFNPPILNSGMSFKCAIAKGTVSNIVEMAVFETSNEDPNITLNACVNWLKQRQFDSLGIASFGPIDLNKSSPTYGYITTTPKKAWRNANVLGAFKQAFPSVPINFDTDVNAPALAEYDNLLAAASSGSSGSGLVPDSVCYITVGTGIGVGVVAEGRPIHGILHPEAGHVL